MARRVGPLEQRLTLVRNDRKAVGELGERDRMHGVGADRATAPVRQLAASMVTRKPRSSAARAVDETHICVISPAMIRLLRPVAASSAFKSVSANAFGRPFS